MKKHIVRAAFAGALLTLAVPALTACSSDDAAVVEPADVVFDASHVDSSMFAAATEVDGVTIIDVRTPAEFAEGHLPGAVNIDVSAATFADEIAQLDPDADYAVYCRSGNRSRAAIETMQGAGFAALIGLEGGIGAWGGEVVTG
ncbi:rhodanese-like domain-containing protein [Demequina zhanjiangensis]|uniref:Rhodanese-like domain-containing protein n=1 Tax=Demequina zhanjiangensis TaxID=3051659 RepID=A0ABT8G1E0_9MICO|nr:rhodanese-like domain-containing protein [Demequina sp. SYSU T00b26]MDN4472887.1 rhodanese-like domain-containing protein [Demequina sp. SYSU T00b26]